MRTSCTCETTDFKRGMPNSTKRDSNSIRGSFWECWRSKSVVSTTMNLTKQQMAQRKHLLCALVMQCWLGYERGSTPLYVIWLTNPNHDSSNIVIHMHGALARARCWWRTVSSDFYGTILHQVKKNNEGQWDDLLSTPRKSRELYRKNSTSDDYTPPHHFSVLPVQFYDTKFGKRTEDINVHHVSKVGKIHHVIGEVLEAYIKRRHSVS